MPTKDPLILAAILRLKAPLLGLDRWHGLADQFSQIAIEMRTDADRLDAAAVRMRTAGEKEVQPYRDAVSILLAARMRMIRLTT